MLKRGILVIFRANVISLLFNLLTSFLLPKFLSFEAYAAIKLFQLYITYVGLLHLGFADGMYLQYGGANKDSIDKRNIKASIISMRSFQIVITVLCLTINILIKDPIWIAFSLAVLPLNMSSYFKLLYQAIGEFDKYGKIMNITTAATFAANMILLFLFCIREKGIPYILAYVVLDVAIWMYLELQFENEFKLKDVKGAFSFKVLYHNIKDGILLMLGNLSSTLFTGIDRWFVKVLMDTLAFAQYSFAVTIENFSNIAVTAVSVTLYNYFCNHTDVMSAKKILSHVILFATALPVCAFPAKLILEIFLPKYTDSTCIIFYLFAAQTYGIINKCVYINLYKAKREQKKYFVRLVFVLIMGFALNGLFWMILKDKTAFALGTLLANLIWFIISVIDFSEVRPKIEEFILILGSTIVFMLCGIMMGAIVGFIVYTITFACLVWLLMRMQMLDIIEIGKKALDKRK